MTDYFALLDFPRSPWLDADEVKARFTQCSASVHPDRVHQEAESIRQAAAARYAELNAARQCLASTRSRLRHLLELETGQSPGEVGAVPADVSDWFFAVGGVLRRADDLIRQKRAATSPMVQAQLSRRILEETGALRGLLQKLEQQRGEFDELCRQLAADWESGAHELESLTRLVRNYAFLDRWIEQLRERLLQLTL
jgi:hypothetical protein